MHRNISIATALIALAIIAIVMWPSTTQPNVRKNVEAEKFNPRWSAKE